MSMIANYLAVSAQELQALVADPSRVEAVLFEEREEDIVDLDKAWQGLHFTLTGSLAESDAPLAQAIMGGAPLGEDDYGYGPPRYLTPDQVARTAHALDAYNEQSFRESVDLAALAANHVYPEIWQEGDTATDYLVEYFETLKYLFRDARREGQGLILYLA
ncbi:MAG: YfbM family protein [Magnetospiraceae bacterium]